MQDDLPRGRLARYLTEYRRERHCSIVGGYVGKLGPHAIVDVPAVTLAATNKALWPVANIKAMGKDFWDYAGKEVEIEVKGRITTVLTPGNLILSIVYGTGADANGVSLASSAAQTLVASQTNITWSCRFTVRCISTGATGTLFADGEAFFESAVIAARWFQIPATAPAVSAACDLTVAGNIINLQANRSGSTAETMQVHRITVRDLN
jgi:hypothetical protein